MKSFSRPTVKLGVFPLVAVFLCLLALPSVAAAALTGPIYPLPGGPGSGHGGNVCAATSALGISPGGVTWTFGGGTPTSLNSCPPSTTAAQPFNTSRFAKLFWGSRSGARPQVAMDGSVNSALETLSFAPAPLSDIDHGVVVWTGSTTLNGCKPSCGAFTPHAIATRVKLTILSGTSGTAPADLKTPGEAGIGDPQVGGVVEVTSGPPALTNFRAKIEVLASDDGGSTFQAAQTLFNSYNNAGGDLLVTHFTGAFWYENKAPNATFGPPNHQNPDSPITFTAQVSDDDGSVGSFAWDFDDDGTFAEFVNQANAQWAFPPGDHRVRLRAIDNEGTATTFTRMLHILPRADADGDGYLTPADCNNSNAAIHPGAAEVHDNGVDENCNGNGDDPDPDRDKDGFSPPGDCVDSNASIHPGATDIPDNNVDENCDGVDTKTPPLKQVAATVSYTYSAFKKYTRISRLQVKLVPRGSLVTVTCKSKKKCPKKARKKFTKRNASGTVKVKKFVGKFKVGAVIEVRVTVPGQIGIARRVKIRKKKSPSSSTLCLPPGATTPSSCL